MATVRKITIGILMILMLQISGISGCTKVEGDSSLLKFWFTTFDVMVDIIMKSGGTLEDLTREEIVSAVVDAIRDAYPDNAVLEFINLESIAFDVYDFIYQSWQKTGFVSREAQISDTEVMIRISKL